MSSYDQNLLDEVPKATRAQLQVRSAFLFFFFLAWAHARIAFQEGYNVDLLEQPPRRTPSTRNPPPQALQAAPAPVTVPLMQDAAENGSGEKFRAPTYPPSAPKPHTSFWRTRNGIITIVLVVLVVIGAVVGGAVGGTVTKGSSNKVAASPSASASATATSASPTSTGTDDGSTATQAIAGGGLRTTTSTARPAATTSAR